MTTFAVCHCIILIILRNSAAYLFGRMRDTIRRRKNVIIVK
jgi:hypothetical protein